MERTRLKIILALALPIIGGMTSQNVLNLVDTAMVGTLGDAALAGVGLAGFLAFMSHATLMGFSAAVQAMSSRRVGEGRDHEVAVPLNGGLLLSVLLGFPLCVALYQLCPHFFPFLIDDSDVVGHGNAYFQARILGLAAVGMNFSFRGYWNGVNLSRLYMQTLLIQHTANICLNYLLIFGKFGFPELGAEGAGLGTAIATWIGSFWYFSLGFRHARKGGFLRGVPGIQTFRVMARLAWPATVQTFLFASGLATMFWIIGMIGTTELAAAQVLVNIMLVAILPGVGLGLAAASLVGQALGRGEPEDAKQWGWDVAKVGAVTMVLLGLPMLLFPRALLMVFLYDPATLELAVWPLRIAGAGIGFDAIGMILLNGHTGAGATKTAAAVSVVFQWVIFLPVAYVLAAVLGYGLIEVWIAQMSYRAIQAIFLSGLWQRGAWARIRV